MEPWRAWRWAKLVAVLYVKACAGRSFLIELGRVFGFFFEIKAWPMGLADRGCMLYIHPLVFIPHVIRTIRSSELTS